MKTTVMGIHVWDERGKDHEASLDCWCEPQASFHVEGVPIVVHGEGVAIVMQEKVEESDTPSAGEEE